MYRYISFIVFAIVVYETVGTPKTIERGSRRFFLQEARQHGLSIIEPKSAEFNKTYDGNVTQDKSDVYRYNISALATNRSAVRIFTTGNHSVKEFPTIFVIRQERSVISWQIPLLLSDAQAVYEYKDVSRTLCPVDLFHEDQRIYVEISTQANISVPYTLKAQLVDSFIIQTGIDHHVSSSPSKPVYYKYIFPADVQSVLIRARSSDKLCAVLSIQNTKCPVFDLDTDIDYQGKYQTMTTQGAITVDKAEYLEGSFFVVVVVKPNDNNCNDGLNHLNPPDTINIRQKTVTINIKATIPSSLYYKAIFAATGVFVAFYIVAILIGIFYHGCKENWGIIDLSTFESSMSQETERPILESSGGGAQGYGSMVNPVADTDTGRTHTASDDVSSLNSDDFDFVKDADHEKDVLRTKTALYVCDLARKSEKRADKNYKLYCKNLFTIAVFYGLPVIQLVMTYQAVLNFTGDQDICYYNFACAHPLGRVSAFNNIYSNIGYVLLGLLFVLLVCRREWLHKKAVEGSAGRDKKFGIPQHFGLFYAMGFALCMEGIMSACYHVCPTVSNFQFDTSFMYIIACLCILKIYQNRHPDISAKAHSSYLVMAIVIIIAVIGVVYGTSIFWILFAIVYMGASLVLSIHLYYMGRWKLDQYIFKRLWLMIISDWLKCSKPMYLNRLILLILGNVVNWSIAIYGVAKNNTSDFASFLLGIFIGNLLLYTMFYIISKIMAREKIPKLTLSFIILAAVSWGFALYFFFAHLTSWQLSPAASREGNEECLLFQFYDKHDVWHFLSAISLFFSFLVLLTLDDEIILIRRDKIPVF